MDRKRFLRNALLGGAAALAPRLGRAASRPGTYDRLREQVGFNHLPTPDASGTDSVFHPADSRGGADHGWLRTRHSFSFASWYDPQRMHFGALRVLNDDVVAGGGGFPTHPHDNMEILSIPLSGDLEHRDSMGNVAVIREGDVQVMSAGTGIRHSEFNRHADREVRFLQIWMFPRAKGVAPRYDQVRLDPAAMDGRMAQILSPDPDDAGVWVHQDAWFDLGRLPAGTRFTHRLRRPGNGLYAFLIDGAVRVNGQVLGPRDGYGVWNTDRVAVETAAHARLLLMEVPMRF